MRLVHPSTPGHLLALAGAVGFAGNWLAAGVRSRVGQRLESPALIADGNHARADAYVSLAVIASAIAIAAGAPVLDPAIGLGMAAVILRITRHLDRHPTPREDRYGRLSRTTFWQRLREALASGGVALSIAIRTVLL